MNLVWKSLLENPPELGKMVVTNLPSRCYEDRLYRLIQNKKGELALIVGNEWRSEYKDKYDLVTDDDLKKVKWYYPAEQLEIDV